MQKGRCVSKVLVIALIHDVRHLCRRSGVYGKTERSRARSWGKQLNARSVRGNFECKYCFGSASLSAFRVFLAFENTNIYEFRENIDLCCLIWEKETIVPFLDATTIEDTHTSEYTSYLWLSRKL